MNKLKVGAVVTSTGEDNKKDVEPQIQNVKSENNPGDRVEEIAPKAGDETSEKGSKAMESSGEARDDVGADKVKSETASGEVAHIAAALTEEPEAQDQTVGRSSDDAAARPANPQPTPAAAESQPQAAARANSLYWRRLTARYMTTSPMPT
jgi:hypothetical protein